MKRSTADHGAGRFYYIITDPLAHRVFDILYDVGIVIDRFYVVHCCALALDNIRREAQKRLPDSQRKYFKRLRRLPRHSRSSSSPS